MNNIIEKYESPTHKLYIRKICEYEKKQKQLEGKNQRLSALVDKIICEYEKKQKQSEGENQRLSALVNKITDEHNKLLKYILLLKKTKA